MKSSLKERLTSIRVLIDTDVTKFTIDELKGQGLQLSAMIGLSAECKSEARKELDCARLAALIQIENKKYPPSVMLKIAEAMCSDEFEVYEYADRINAGITHQLDYYRTIISLYKTELENTYKNV
jgi:hypothetical protein